MLSLCTSAFGYVFFSSRRRHTRYWRDWSSDVCSSDLSRSRVRARARLDQAFRLSTRWKAAKPGCSARPRTRRQDAAVRLGEGRVGAEGRCRWLADHLKKKELVALNFPLICDIHIVIPQ